MTENELRQKVVSIAQSYIGCNEKDGTHKQIIDAYNAHKPLARGYKVQYTDAWCATFGSFCAIKAGLTDIIPTECGCSAQITLFKNLGSWQENDAYVPKPGDYIFYDWQDTGVGDNTGAPDHVGIVEKVVGNTITVIEGNYSDSVKRRTIQVNGRYIRGYGVPKYASKATVQTTTKIDKEDVNNMTIDEFINKLTDKQAYTLLAKAQNYAGTILEPEWSKNEGHWAKAKSKGLVDGTRPEANIKRDEFVAVIGRAGLL